MSDHYYTPRENLFERLIDRRVRVTITSDKNRERVYVGTFKAYDYKVNVVLADAYRVILNVTEEQRKDVKGLMFFRGAHVKTVKYEHQEKSLPKWPTAPRRAAKKTVQSPVRNSQLMPKVSETSTSSMPSSKPLKLKRSWLTSGSTQTSLAPTVTQKVSDKGTSITEQKENTTEESIDSSKEQVEESPIDKGNIPIDKGNAEGEKANKKVPVSPTFDQFINNNYDFDEGMEYLTVKEESHDDSCGSNISLSP